ncbi:MAG: hypothetical protein ACRC0R_03955 [Cetobacterium sp.]
MFDRFSLIRGALTKLGIPFDESSYFSDTIIQLAELEFERITTSAFVGSNLSFNSTMAKLNVSVDDKITYDGIIYTPYMLPDDFLFLHEKPVENVFIGRNRIYRDGEGEFTIRYTKVNTVDKLNDSVFKYLEYYLASELAPAVNRRSLQNELLEKAMFYKDALGKNEVKNNVDLFGLFASQSGI